MPYMVSRISKLKGLKKNKCMDMDGGCTTHRQLLLHTSQ